MQARIATITDRQLEYAAAVRDRLAGAGIRVELDGRPEKIGFKIREAALEKVPYVLVVGDREVQSNAVAVRERGGADLGSMKPDEFIGLVQENISAKRPTTELVRG